MNYIFNNNLIAKSTEFFYIDILDTLPILKNVDLGNSDTNFRSSNCINAYVQYIVDYKDKEAT